MSGIRAIRNDGKEYSKAEGSLKTIFKMISTLPESKSRQIIVDKEEFDKFISNTRMMKSVLKSGKFVDEKEVYVAPTSINMLDGLMELTI